MRQRDRVRQRDRLRHRDRKTKRKRAGQSQVAQLVVDVIRVISFKSYFKLKFSQIQMIKVNSFIKE